MRPPLLPGGVARYRAAFESARPFRHVTIDGFLAPDVARRASSVYPPLSRRQRLAARLLGSRSYASNVGAYDPLFREMFDELEGDAFVGQLRELTGIADLRADPTRAGAGVHQGVAGSVLHVHADFNAIEPEGRTLYRRLNVIVYVNEGWREEWDGALELYDAACSRAEQRIPCGFNSAAIVEVHDRAYHGYRRLRLPHGVARKSIVAHYYSAVPHAEQSPQRHSTLFARPADVAPLELARRRAARAIEYRIPGLLGLVPRATHASAGARQPAAAASASSKRSRVSTE